MAAPSSGVLDPGVYDGGHPVGPAARRQPRRVCGGAVWWTAGNRTRTCEVHAPSSRPRPLPRAAPWRQSPIQLPLPGCRGHRRGSPSGHDRDLRDKRRLRAPPTAANRAREPRRRLRRVLLRPRSSWADCGEPNDGAPPRLDRGRDGPLSSGYALELARRQERAQPLPRGTWNSGAERRPLVPRRRDAVNGVYIVLSQISLDYTPLR